MKISVSLPVLALMAVWGCSSPENSNKQDYQLGELKHEFPISAAARANFDKGLLLLHSFQYEDAKEAFLAAQGDDQGELMAYWGETMCNYKALWGLQNLPGGREAMAKLGSNEQERMSKAENELEREFWAGVEILFGEGEFLERNTKYATYMQRLYDKYPHNQEVAAFYSLALIWAAYGENEESNMELASEVASAVIKENPTHPGALHYKIHSNDNPEHAPLALAAANDYANVAPDAAHALHMPSHIYVALGMWNEVVSSNTEAYGASVTRMINKGLDGRARDYHNMAWLHYGYLQQGRYDKATDLLKEMISYYADSTHSDSYLIMMQNEQRIESGVWPSDVEPIQVQYDKLGLQEKSGLHFFRSLLAYDRGDAGSIANEIKTLSRIHETSKLLVTEDGIVRCGGRPTRYAPNQEDLSRTQVVLHQMEALKAMLQHDDRLAETHLVEATKLESALPYDEGPPFIAYPSFEQYGDWLLRNDRAEEALGQFDTSLSKRKNRAKALRGKINALTLLGRLNEAEATQKILHEFWSMEGAIKV